MTITRHWVCLAVPVKKRSRRRTLRRSTILIVIRVTRHLQRGSQKLEKLTSGLPAGIYTTNNPEPCQYVAHDCKANILVVENQKQLDKILQVRDQLPHLKAIVQYKGKLSQDYENTYDWEQFMDLGKDIENSVIEEKMAVQKPNQCALLIYTSGTTGNP